jgi:hypothetical protein
LMGTNNGTLQNGATYAPGQEGYAFSFNGVNQFISVPDSPAWHFGTNAFTLEVWANFSSASGTYAMLANDEGGGNTHKWIFWLSGSTLQFQGGTITNSFNIVSAPFSPTMGQWYHIVLTRNGSVFTYYINGRLQSSIISTAVMPSPTNAPLTIGNAEGNFYFNGLLDDIRIYHRDLAASEIQAIYEAGTNGMCTPSPIPSFFGTQPDDQTLLVGATASFSAIVECSTSFSYQWRKNGQPIPQANGPTYAFGPIQLSDAAGYDVVASNQFGWATSRVATLSIIPSSNTNCAVSAPSGLVSCWAGEGNANDSVGTNNGTLENGVTFVPGEVGEAFRLNGVNQFISVPASPSWGFGTNSFTLELWANFSSISGPQTMLANDEGGGNTHKWIFWLNGSTLQLFGGDETNSFTIISEAFSPLLGEWYHIALTRSEDVFLFYIDGSLYSGFIYPFVIPSPKAALTIGNAEGGFNFTGLLDDVRIYDRELSAAEVQAIYQAGTNGMCPPTPLVFAAPPAYTKGNGVVLNASLRSGQSYSLQANTNLASTNWIILTNFTAGTAPVISLTNKPPSNVQQQFYRIATP